MKLYGLKTCDTCRKALKSLPEAEFLDVRDSAVPETVLEMALEAFDEKLINTRSTTWRNLADDERKKPPIALLKAHPALMKRPLLVTDDGTFLLGWTAQTKATLGVD